MPTYTSLTASSALTFDDEFNSFLASPDGSVGWMTTYPWGGESARALPSNGQAEYLSDATVGVDPFSDSNGVLTISATQASAGSNPYGLPYISGLITTYQSFAQQYGYFEVDAELPAGQGLWSAFFLLPDQVTFASELDVFEVLGNSPTTLYSTVHGFDDGVQTATTAILNTADTSAGFHTYGVDWEPATTTFYIDGAAVASMPTPATMDNPMYMLLTLAVGSAGSWPGAPTSSTSFPANLQIDDVRAYATANTILVSGTQAIRTGGISGQVLLAGAAGAGVGISLLNAAGSVVASTTAATDGTFAFTGLAAGSYQLSYSAPSGVVLQTAGGLTSSITVATGQTTALASQNLVAASIAEVSGNVVVNGVEQAGAAVTLLTSNGKTVASTVTNSTGSFAFTGLAPGIYAVKYAALSGTVLPTGGTAASNGVTPTFALAAGQMLSLPAEDLLTSPSTITAKALHFGGPTDPSYGGGDLGVTVSLLNAAGSVIATTVSNATGWCAFGSIAPGTYEIRYTAPAGQTASPGTSLLTAPFSVAAGQTLAAPVGSLMTALTMSGSNVTLAPGSGAYVVTGNASNSTLTLGAGNQYVNLTGSGNTITVGTGTSTISAGTGNDVVHAAGGNVTITATGSGNLFDSGPGISFLNADGSAGNVFLLNPAATGTLTTISGFNAAGDSLDLRRTLAGTGIQANLSNLSQYVTASTAASGTTLYVDPTGGHGTAHAFAVLTGVATSVAQIQALHGFSLT